MRQSSSGLLRSAPRFWKVWLVAADCCLIGMQPVLTHLTKNEKKEYSFHPISVTLMIDAAKTSLSLLVLLIYGPRKGSRKLQWSPRVFYMTAYANKSLLIPASLYTLNGYIKFMMLLYFTPTTAKMLGNLKVLVIAVLMKFILRRSFSFIQWEALILLCVGISINQLNRCMDQAYQIPPAAILYTTGSLLIPSLASIFNEWALKRHMETSVHLQSFFLCFFGLCFNLVALLCVSVANHQSVVSLFKGQSKYGGLLVLNNALQGILASFFYKYADTILKKYSSTLATVFTALMSAFLFGQHLTINFLLAIITVFCSMHIFFSQGGLKSGMKASESNAHLSESRLSRLANLDSQYALEAGLHKSNLNGTKGLE